MKQVFKLISPVFHFAFIPQFFFFTILFILYMQYLFDICIVSNNRCTHEK